MEEEQMQVGAEDLPKMPHALKFEVVAQWNRARVGKLALPHHTCDTPMFMPVGTQGTIKGITSQQLEELDCQVILGNTYHLGHRPGGEYLFNCFFHPPAMVIPSFEDNGCWWHSNEC